MVKVIFGERTYCYAGGTAHPTNFLMPAQAAAYSASPVLFASEEEARKYMQEEWGGEDRLSFVEAGIVLTREIRGFKSRRLVEATR